MSNTIGSWQPVAKIEITEELLAQYLTWIADADLASLQSSFPAAEITRGAGLMKLQASDWQVAEKPNDEQLETLIRFFTLAEAQLVGWDAGQTSPVIFLVKILKQRGAFDPELKRWIKSNTDNRYLPNGAVVL